MNYTTFLSIDGQEKIDIFKRMEEAIIDNQDYGNIMMKREMLRKGQYDEKNSAKINYANHQTAENDVNELGTLTNEREDTNNEIEFKRCKNILTYRQTV